VPAAENHLIERLPRAEQARLKAMAEPVELVLSTVLCEPQRPTQHVYFPVDGFISLVTTIEDHPGLEVGMVGREGMLGMQLALGVTRTPWRAVVQGAGMARRVDADGFKAEVDRSPVLRRLLLRYVQVQLLQMTGAAACLRYHQIGPRLARWLLMSHDRARQEQFSVTHEFLAYMLGVRRVGVTVAAGGLQRAGLIRYRRGELTVVDRAGLELAACGCYANDRQTYADLME
jgi:CRP-like cAMP-binding protein